jgi:PAS domain S-box-containing protein
MTENKQLSSSESLRQQALARLSDSAVSLSELSHEQILKLAHELQVHQIELELQNEELKSTTAELERAQLLFSTIFNRSPTGYLLLDEQGIVQEANLTFCNLIKSSLDQVLGKPVQTFIDDADRPAFLSRYRALFRQPKDKLIELRLKHPQKGFIWVRLQAERLSPPKVNEHEPQTEWLLLAVVDLTAQKAAEQALRLSEQRYRNLIENSRDLVYRISFVPQQHFEYVSPSATAITGYTPEEHYADPYLGYKLIHPEDLPLLQKIATEGIKPDQKLVLRWRRKDGRLIWTEQQNTPIFDAQGNLIALEGFARDVTERKEAELALQNLLQEYDVLFNGVQDAVFLIEVDEAGEFRYLRTNLAHQKKTGISLEMIQGKTPIELVGEELGSVLCANYQRCLDSGQPVTYEETLDLPGGRRTWSTTLTPVWREGRIKYIVGAATDITEQKAALETIHLSEQRYRTLFANMVEGFALHEMIWDDNGQPIDYRFLEVNPAFEKLTGLKAEQVIGKTARQILPGLEPYWIKRYGEVAAGGGEQVFEEYTQELGKWYEVRAFCPKPGYFAAVFVDVTQRKRLEAEREQLIQDLQRKNAELGQFTYTVSHDLKSPLITILGFLAFVEQSLEQGDLAQAKADLQRIRFAAEKMQALLEGLLELSRIGRVANAPSRFPIGEVVMEAVQLLFGNIQHQGRTVDFEIAPGLPLVYGDRARLLQVMQNLLDNALKYMGEQPNPRIEIGWRDAPDEIHLFVRDNGIGIEAEQQEKIFGLFEKLDPRAQGYGVGLALVKRIIEVHGGRVWVESEGEGKGSTFWFSLPKTHQT